MNGLAVSPGIAIAKAYIIDEPQININNNIITEESINKEIELLYYAIEKTKIQLQYIYETAVKRTQDENAAIIQTHIAFADDQVLIDSIKEKVKTKHYNIVLAVDSTICEQVELFGSIEDLYIRERAADIKDVGRRIIKNLLGIPLKDILALTEDVIIVSKELTPSMIAGADIAHVKGLISEMGSVTSHSAILARSMDIPAVFGIEGIIDSLKEGQLLAIDGSKGIIQIDVDSKKLSNLQEQIYAQNSMKEVLKKLIDVKAATLDEHVVELSANIGNPKDVIKAVENGAEGIGLFRTEFLYMEHRTLPTEEEQFLAYKQVAEGMGSKPVIIRTLDVGGDKEIPCINIGKEGNPFMGYRAIRVCLNDKEMFKAQLRAILRASAYGNVRIMYPMISSVDEVIIANTLLEKAKFELETEAVEFNKKIEVGIMIEIPSAAITADIIVKHVDFFSIGTNDLIQYTLAVDRTNEKVNYLYNGFNPAVLRLIQNVIDVSHRYGKFTGMCGELAGNPVATILLLGMGLDEFSMSSSSILKVKKIIASTNFSDAKQVRDEVLRLNDSSSIEQYLMNVLTENKLDYLLNI